MFNTVAPLFLGPPEIAILVLVVVLLFAGPKLIPKLARSTGEATQEWKRGLEESGSEFEKGMDESDE